MMRSDFVIEKFTRCAVARDAVAEHAAEFVVFIENGAGNAFASQLVSRRESRGSATDDRNPVFANRGQVAEFITFAFGGITDKLLDRVDADKVVDVVTITALFTGGGADASHHRWERIGIGGTTEGIFLHAHAFGRELDTTHDVEPAADIFARRTTALAGGCAMYVGRAFVGGILVEDIFALRTPAMHTILIHSKGELLVHFVF